MGSESPNFPKEETDTVLIQPAGQHYKDAMSAHRPKAVPSDRPDMTLDVAET